MARTALLGAGLALIGLALALPAAAGASTSGLIAPPSACPGQSDRAAGAAAQVRAMRCMTNYARASRGKQSLVAVRPLRRAARGKAADILRCDEFDHSPCGRDFTYWFERVGYAGRCTAMGENIAWGTGSLGSVRAIFAAWIRSPGHRANIFGPYAEIGIWVRVGTLEGNPGARVWTQEFGSRSC